MMRDLFKKLFVAEEPIITPEKAFSEVSGLYSSKDFEKYNPDDLIGLKGAPIYRKMMKDEQVKAAVKFKRDAVTSRDYTFYIDEDLDQDEKSSRIDLYKYIIKKIDGSFLDAINGVMSAIYNGVSFSEVLLHPIAYKGATWQGIKKIKLKPYESFCFEIDDYGEIRKFYQKSSQQKIQLNMDNFIHYVVNPDMDDHYGSSELREAYRAWFSKDTLIKFRNMWLERHAGGFRWAQTREGKQLNTNSTEYANLQAVLKNINTSTGAIMPSSVELMSDYPSDTQAFDRAIDMCDMQISRALLVPPLLGVSPQGDTGSYSQSNTQLEAFFWTLESEVLRLEETLNEQLFKRIGKINYGDNGYPQIKFKPLSQTKTLELVSKWAELAEKGIVTMSEGDEEYIRSLIEMPVIEEEVKSLTKEQTDSIVGLVEKVSAGTLSADTARRMIINLYPVNEEMAEELLEGIEVAEPEPEPEEEAQDQPEPSEPEPQDETVSGKSLISVTAFAKSKSIKRVNFAKIASETDQITTEYTNEMGSIGGEIVADLLDKSQEAQPSLEEGTMNAIKALKVDGRQKRRLNSVSTQMLREAYKSGTQEAEREVDMAMKKAFCREADRDRLKFIADDYFQTTAFKISGDLSAEYVKVIESVILQGSRSGWGWEQTREEVYKALASKGLVSKNEAVRQLADALNVQEPDARLATIVRTSSFDAVNNARDAYFRDPQLDGFVVAYEYSSILDSRTTQICRHLDEQNAGNHSLEWYSENAGYKPPNHYNCRSLLIPVTTNDLEEYEDGPEPSQSPQAGFGG